MANLTQPERTSDERVQLEALARRRGVHVPRRARIILAAARGDKPDAIAGAEGVTRQTVRRWLRAFSVERMGVFPGGQRARPAREAPKPAPALVSEEPLALAELCRRHQLNMAHARHVAALAIELYDRLAPLHMLPRQYRDATYYGALLHNIGLAGGVKDHDVRGREILLEQPLVDLDDTKRRFAAISAGFHRRRWKPGRLDREPLLKTLEPQERVAALWVSGIVRVADGLDYAHSQATELRDVQISPGGVEVLVDGPFVDQDAPRADGKADMLLGALDVSLRVRAHSQPARELPPRPLPTDPQPPALSPDDPVSEAGRRVLAYHLGRMRAEEQTVRDEADVEAVHKMRVATRRMRAALRIFGDFYRRRVRRTLSTSLGEAADALGRVRDLDVILAHARTYAEGLDEDGGAAFQDVLMAWEGRRARRYIQLITALDGAAYAEFVSSFQAFCTTPGLWARSQAPDEPGLVRHIAPGVVYAHYEALRAYEPLIASGEVEEDDLHRLRILFKRFRYTLEFFESVLGPETPALIELARRVQDHLGHFQDANVARDLALRGAARAVKRLGRLDRRAAQGKMSPESAARKGERALRLRTACHAYASYCVSEAAHLQEAFLPLWAEVISAETRRDLALAVSVL